MSDILQWTLAHGYTNVDRPARNNLLQPFAETVCGLENLPKTMDDRDR